MENKESKLPKILESITYGFKWSFVIWSAFIFVAMISISLFTLAVGGDIEFKLSFNIATFGFVMWIWICSSLVVAILDYKGHLR